MKIEVSRDDIVLGQESSGKLGRCHLCPVARAISRCLGISEFYVLNDHVTIKHRKFPLPTKVSKFIHQADMGGTDNLKPFSFNL
jgi:hypothetical protein